ncbi:SRPBCC family protein [Prescottella agglutinans]|uniref:SRPBCC family protein n=1 Tax=Prescottella agglutinans TaxID=1644129 RepID=A0A3S3AI41_9NOCA|nr:SRPBCC family protein [Prescottella agglutinans]
MSRPAPVCVSVSKVIPARPSTLYNLISDVTRMGDFSPETVSARWLDDARGPRIGARFEGTNRIGRARWSTEPEVVSAEPGQRFAFRVPGRAGALWTYTFERTAGGSTLVTESMQQGVPSPLPVRILQRLTGVTDRAEHLRQGMTTTLDRLGDEAVTHERRVRGDDPNGRAGRPSTS